MGYEKVKKNKNLRSQHEISHNQLVIDHGKEEEKNWGQVAFKMHLCYPVVSIIWLLIEDFIDDRKLLILQDWKLQIKWFIWN